MVLVRTVDLPGSPTARQGGAERHGITDGTSESQSQGAQFGGVATGKKQSREGMAMLAQSCLRLSYGYLSCGARTSHDMFEREVAQGSP